MAEARKTEGLTACEAKAAAMRGEVVLDKDRDEWRIRGGVLERRPSPERVANPQWLETCCAMDEYCEPYRIVPDPSKEQP